MGLVMLSKHSDTVSNSQDITDTEDNYKINYDMVPITLTKYSYTTRNLQDIIDKKNYLKLLHL